MPARSHRVRLTEPALPQLAPTLLLMPVVSLSCPRTPPQSATGTLEISDVNRALYTNCASTTLRPDGSACSAAEDICYKCYCYEALNAGMFKRVLVACAGNEGGAAQAA